MEEERRDLSRENRFLWQRTADLGERLARLEQAGGEEEETAAQDGAASSRKIVMCETRQRRPASPAVLAGGASFPAGKVKKENVCHAGFVSGHRWLRLHRFLFRSAGPVPPASLSSTWTS